MNKGVSGTSLETYLYKIEYSYQYARAGLCSVNELSFDWRYSSSLHVPVLTGSYGVCSSATDIQQLCVCACANRCIHSFIHPFMILVIP